MPAGTLNKVRRVFSWSLLGFVLAAIVGGMTVYIEFFRDERPALQYEILSDFSVLDVREEVTDLKIIHAGVDLRESGQSLRVIVVRISNIGAEDILSAFYDDKAPLGFSVENGTLVSAEIQDTSETYLDDRLELHVKGPSQVAFSPAILGSESYFSVRVLIQHLESSKPSIVPIGKVARVSDISLVQAPIPQTEGFWSRTFTGSIWTQVVRISTYLFLLILLITCIGVPISILSEGREKRRRRKNVKTFKRNSSHEIRPEYEVVFSDYIARGEYFVSEVAYVLSDNVDLDEIGAKLERQVEATATSNEANNLHDVVIRFGDDEAGSQEVSLFTARKLFTEGIIEESDGRYTRNARFQQMFSEFQKFLSLIAD